MINKQTKKYENKYKQKLQINTNKKHEFNLIPILLINSKFTLSSSILSRRSSIRYTIAVISVSRSSNLLFRLRLLLPSKLRIIKKLKILVKNPKFSKIQALIKDWMQLHQFSSTFDVFAFNDWWSSLNRNITVKKQQYTKIRIAKLSNEMKHKSYKIFWIITYVNL